MSIERVVLGADHGGVSLKAQIISHLQSRNIESVDLGVHSEESVDYPDIAREVCDRLLSDRFDLAVLVCGTGIGMSIAANKIPGVRCAVVHDLYTAEKARTHNNANAVAFGGRVEYPNTVEDMLDSFLDNEFAGGRHLRRIEKISRLD